MELAEELTLATKGQANKQFSNGKAKEDFTKEMMMAIPEDYRLENMTDVDKTREKRTIMKNIIVIATAWVMVLSAWGGLFQLQSSLHRDEGMGAINISVLHIALTISSILFPKPVIHLIGHKYAIILGLFTYILWAGANGYAVWGTMVPVSILVGLASAPMWTAQQTYYTLFANRYALLANEDEHAVISWFIGLFFGLGSLGGISASIISSTVLRQPKNNISEEALQYCGIDDCPWVNITNPNIEKPPQWTVWIMLIIYISTAIVGLIILIMFVDQLPKWLIKKEESLRKQTLKFFAGSAKQMMDKKQIALIPITMYCGFEQGALGAEFTRSYVTCTLGIWNIGYVMIPYAVIHGLMSLGVSRLVKYTGRLSLFTLGLFLDAAIQITLIAWKPVPSQGWVLFVIVVMWGLSDAIWQNQIASLYAVIFKDLISAFAIHGLWTSLGWVIAFGYSPYLCTGVKLYILLAMLIISSSGYYLTEYWCRKEKRLKLTNQENTSKDNDKNDSADEDDVKNDSANEDDDKMVTTEPLMET